MLSLFQGYRRGATRNVGDGKLGPWGIFFVCLISLVIPYLFWQGEHEYHSKTDAFKQLSIVSVTPENCPPSETGVASCIRRAVREQHDPASGKVPAFHLITDASTPNFKLQSSAEDSAFGVKLRDTLHLKRNVEYCQWREHYTEQCEQCRDGRDSSGNPKYKQCNCKRTFHYVKGWHGYRINSLLFDQPGAHHNPQRDPYPSQDFFSQNAKIGSTGIDVALLANEHSSVRGEAHYIDWNPTASHSYNKGSFDWLFFWQDRSKDTHYYPTSDLKGYHNSEATKGSEGFKYVGGSYGYFLSKYDWKQHMFEQAVRWGYMFIQEGTAMDFQMSDILGQLFGACTPGDIRVHYTAQFIDVASMMGAVHPRQDLLTTQTISIKGGGNTKENYQLGVVHKGSLSATEMLRRELSEGRALRWIFRAILFVWAAMFFPNIFGPVGVPLGISVASAIMAGCWTHFWGVHLPTLFPLGVLFTVALVSAWSGYKPQTLELPAQRTTIGETSDQYSKKE